MLLIYCKAKEGINMEICDFVSLDCVVLSRYPASVYHNNLTRPWYVRKSEFEEFWEVKGQLCALRL